jgi:predicted CoA-binding protein
MNHGEEGRVMSSSRSAIQEIIAQRTLALVGVSRGGKKFGNAILRELREKGDKVLPVHHQVEMIDGERCFPDLKSLPERVGAVIICVPPAQSEQILKQAVETGITRVWLQKGAESYKVLRFCESHNLTTVEGQCILMFAEPVKSVHSVHRWIWKLIGKYPSAHADHRS